MFSGYEKYLLVAANRNLVQLNLQDGSTRSIPSIQASSSYAIAYDKYAEKVYWTDKDLHTIKRASLYGTGVETIWTGNRCSC